MDTRSHDGAASAALIATVAALLDPLEAVLKPLGRVCVAFSGGVDSSVVLAVAARVLGAGRLRFLVTRRAGEDENPDHPPRTVRECDGPAYCLVGLLRIDAQPDGDID